MSIFALYVLLFCLTVLSSHLFSILPGTSFKTGNHPISHYTWNQLHHLEIIKKNLASKSIPSSPQTLCHVRLKLHIFLFVCHLILFYFQPSKYNKEFFLIILLLILSVSIFAYPLIFVVVRIINIHLFYLFIYLKKFTNLPLER